MNRLILSIMFLLQLFVSNGQQNSISIDSLIFNSSHIVVGEMQTFIHEGITIELGTALSSVSFKILKIYKNPYYKKISKKYNSTQGSYIDTSYHKLTIGDTLGISFIHDCTYDDSSGLYNDYWRNYKAKDTCIFFIENFNPELTLDYNMFKLTGDSILEIPSNSNFGPIMQLNDSIINRLSKITWDSGLNERQMIKFEQKKINGVEHLFSHHYTDKGVLYFTYESYYKRKKSFSYSYNYSKRTGEFEKKTFHKSKHLDKKSDRNFSYSRYLIIEYDASGKKINKERGVAKSRNKLGKF